MFNFLKKKDKEYKILSPMKGKVVSINKVSDPTFSEGILGSGVAVIPSDGKVYCPCDGKIEMVFDTLHAINLISDFGAEILIHVGLDTVKLKGNGFKSYVQNGQSVKKGDLLLSVDLEKIKQSGYETITPIVICNTDNYKSVTPIIDIDVDVLDEIISITEK